MKKIILQNHKYKNKCLLLNCDYSPLSIIDWKKAVIWSVKYNKNSKFSIEIIEHYPDQYIQCVGHKIPVPCVAKTSTYYNVYNTNIVKFSRRNLFIRDNYTCQYCNNKFNIDKLTYDHVIPKARFKHNRQSCTTWNNVVTSCLKCNSHKGNRTPIEANMNLLSYPCKPSFSPKYLPWYQELLTMYSSHRNKQWEAYTGHIHDII